MTATFAAVVIAVLAAGLFALWIVGQMGASLAASGLPL
jgi:hypothetical protein